VYYINENDFTGKTFSVTPRRFDIDVHPTRFHEYFFIQKKRTFFRSDQSPNFKFTLNSGRKTGLKNQKYCAMCIIQMHTLAAIIIIQKIVPAECSLLSIKKSYCSTGRENFSCNTCFCTKTRTGSEPFISSVKLFEVQKLTIVILTNVKVLTKTLMSP